MSFPEPRELLLSAVALLSSPPSFQSASPSPCPKQCWVSVPWVQQGFTLSWQLHTTTQEGNVFTVCSPQDPWGDAVGLPSRGGIVLSSSISWGIPARGVLLGEPCSRSPVFVGQTCHPPSAPNVLSFKLLRPKCTFLSPTTSF